MGDAVDFIRQFIGQRDFIGRKQEHRFEACDKVVAQGCINFCAVFGHDDGNRAFCEDRFGGGEESGEIGVVQARHLFFDFVQNQPWRVKGQTEWFCRG